MTDSIECVVVGAGVIGLAIARALARGGREVLIVEREEAIGTHTSSRNSEVLHAGLYYPPGSLKARLCVEGRKAVYAYCESRGVPAKRCGKLIVAVEERETATLKSIHDRATRNGVDDLVFLSKAEAQRLEPEINCVAAMLSPSTGIVDSHALMLSYQGEAEEAGAMLALNCPLIAASADADGFLLSFGGDSPMELRARIVINSAGLFAPAVASLIDGYPKQHVPKAFYARGVYFSLSGKSPFSRLIYPVPVPGGLGTHLTLDLAGQARFGPDVEWIDAIDYTVDATRLPRFVEAIRRYWPNIDPDRMQPGYAGVRPKIAGPGAADHDFVIEGSDVHGLKGLVNLFGLESPGLTASLAVADRVKQAVDADFA